MSNFHNISSYFDSFHPPGCPCKKSAEDFQKHDAEIQVDVPTPDATSLLLLKDMPHDREDFLKLSKKHFIILAQKYHPDKNNTTDKTVCNKIMSMLNSALYNIITKSMENAEPPATVKTKGDKIYTYVAKEIITCQHIESFAVYSHPEHVKGWKKVLRSKDGHDPIQTKKNTNRCSIWR